MKDRIDLTPKQSRKVNALIKRLCCNYDNGNCIRLDDGDPCVCVQCITYSHIIAKLCTRTMKDDAGNTHFYVDEEMRNRLQVRLITRTLAFRVS